MRRLSQWLEDRLWLWAFSPALGFALTTVILNMVNGPPYNVAATLYESIAFVIGSLPMVVVLEDRRRRRALDRRYADASALPANEKKDDDQGESFISNYPRRSLTSLASTFSTRDLSKMPLTREELATLKQSYEAKLEQTLMVQAELDAELTTTRDWWQRSSLQSCQKKSTERLKWLRDCLDTVASMEKDLGGPSWRR